MHVKNGNGNVKSGRQLSSAEQQKIFTRDSFKKNL